MLNQISSKNEHSEGQLLSKETKEETFKRLAAQRTQNVLDKLRVLGNCANKGLYSYSEQDVRRIFRAIDAEIRKIKAQFGNGSNERFEL